MCKEEVEVTENGNTWDGTSPALANLAAGVLRNNGTTAARKHVSRQSYASGTVTLNYGQRKERTSHGALKCQE